MKTFKQYLNEVNRIFPDVAPKKQFGDDTKMKLLSRGVVPPEQNPNSPVDTTGANSPFADKTVKSYNVTPDKPMIGKNDAVKKALAAKGYDETGKKIVKSVERPFPDQARQKQFGDDTKMKQLKFKRNLEADIKAHETKIKKQATEFDTKFKAASEKKLPISTEKQNSLTSNKIVPKPKIRPSLDNTKQSVPIPKPKPIDLNFTSKSKKQVVKPEQTFKQAFASAPEGSEFTWKNKKYKRITKKR